MRRITGVGLGLLLVLLAAGALRVWYASAQQHINRFEDERYSLQNVRKIYHLDDFEPASGYYPSPVFNLPQVWALRTSQFVYERTGRESFKAVGDNGRLLPTGFFLTRLYQALCGTATVLLIFLMGRRLASPRVGLLAAAIFAFLPWMLHSSGYNKPDALLVFGASLAFWTSLRALDRGGVADYAFAGAAIAVAMSAKLTGGLVAVPLTVGTLFFLRGPERFRRAALLVFAGATSAFTFVLLNPYWRAYLHFIQGLQRDYAGRTEASRLEVVPRILKMHVEPMLFGSLFGALALIGTVVVIFRCLEGFRATPRDPVEDRTRLIAWSALLAFPLVYTVAYAVQTSYFKANNFLLIVPLTTLGLAWLLDALWRRVRELIPPRWTGAVGVTAACGVMLFFFLSGFHYVERSVVPSTYDAARLWLHNGFDPAVARLVYRETWQAPQPVWEGTRLLHRGLSAEVASETVDIDAALDADAVLLRLDRAGRDAGLAAQLEAEGWGEVLTLTPKVARLRGPPLLAAKRDWLRVSKVGAKPESCGPACLRTEQPELPGDAEKVVAFLWIPTSFAPPAHPPELHLEGEPRPLPLHIASKKGHGYLFVTPRFTAAPGAELRFIATSDFGPGLADVQIELHGWRDAAD